MTIGARVELGIRAGFPTATTCKLVVASLASGDVTITGPWGSSTVTMTATGTTPASYAGSVNVTGLTAFTRYNYTATQGSKTASGSFMTAPGERDDFSIFFAGCDCNTVYNNPDSGGHVTGFWDKTREYAQSGALPVAGVFFVDDLGYNDLNLASDVANTGFSIPVGGPSGIEPVSSAGYITAYLCNLGMFGPATAVSGNKYVDWGRDADRVWCGQNLNTFPQWGDHEFINDMGIRFPTGEVVNTIKSYVGGANDNTPSQVFTAGKAAWDIFMGPLQPTVFNASNSNGWGSSLGCVNLVAPDRITNANGVWGNGSTIAGGTLPATGRANPTTFYGTNQITDILTYLNATPKAFNLFGMSNSIRNMDNTATMTGSGGQHPMSEICTAEYNRMFRTSGLSPKSLMDNQYTNGLTGVTVLLHSDYHHACVKRHNAAASGSELAENFWSVYQGTVSGSTNFEMPVAEGATYAGTTLEYDSGWLVSQNNYAGLRVDVYGSRSRPEMYVTLLNMDGSVAWQKKWLARSSNGALDIEYEVPNMIGTSSKATTT